MTARVFSLLILGAMHLDASLASTADELLVAATTELWMGAVVKQSNASKVTSLFCKDGVLVATAGLGLRFKNYSEDGWGNPKKKGTTIESYFDWFATLPGQNITSSHNNIMKIADDVWVNNAWVNWVWEGNPGLTARMTFIFRLTPSHTPLGHHDICIFELHSSQLPNPDAGGDTTTTTKTPYDSLDSSSSSSLASSSNMTSLSSLNSLSSGSLGSSAASSYGSGSGSSATESGSSGFYMPVWSWLVLLCCCFLCLGGAGGGGGYMAMGKKKATKKKTKATPAPAPAVEPVAEVPPVMPLATSSTLIPSYSMSAAPATTSYAAPAYATSGYTMAAPAYTTGYAATPAYATSGYTTAAPAYTTGYAATPAYGTATVL